MIRLKEIAGNRGILPLFFMAMECAWLMALFDLVSRGGEKPANIPLGLACLLYPAAYICGRVVRPRNLPKWKEWALGAALGLLGAALLLKPVLFAGQGWTLETLTRPPWTSWILTLICSGFVWLRGWYLAGKRVDLKGMACAFQTGLVVFLVVLPFLGVLGLGAGKSWLLVSGFFVFGLGGMWLAGRTAGEPGAGQSSGTWFVLVVLALSGVLVLGFAVWSLVDRELLEILVRPFVWLWERFADLMKYISTLMPKPKPMALPQHGAAAPNLALPTEKNPLLDLAWLRHVAEFVFIAATSAIVGMALFRTLTDLVAWLRRKFARNVNVAVTSSDYGFLDDLKALFLALFSWLAKLMSFLWKRPEKGPEVSPEAKTVREIYRRFLIWGRSKGTPRETGTTPYEYQARMSLVLPERRDDLSLLTEAYVLVRYGGVIPGPELIRLVRAAWRKIKSSTPLEILKESET